MAKLTMLPTETVFEAQLIAPELIVNKPVQVKPAAPTDTVPVQLDVMFLAAGPTSDPVVKEVP